MGTQKLFNRKRLSREIQRPVEVPERDRGDPKEQNLLFPGCPRRKKYKK
jgi:hypothetical protein